MDDVADEVADEGLESGRAPIDFFELSSFAEAMIVHEHALVKIDPAIPLDRAALLGCAVTTGLGAVFNTAQVQPGTSVAVVGCGGVGLSAIQAARITGANQVIAVDDAPSKLALARQLGATDTVDATTPDLIEEIRDMTGGGAHYSFEAAGAKAAVEAAFSMLRPGGTCTVIGMLPDDQRIEISGPQLLEERRLQGSRMGSNRGSVESVATSRCTRTGA